LIEALKEHVASCNFLENDKLAQF